MELVKEVKSVQLEWNAANGSRAEKDLKRSFDILEKDLVPFYIFIAENSRDSKRYLAGVLEMYQKMNENEDDDLSDEIRIISLALETMQEDA